MKKTNNIKQVAISIDGTYLFKQCDAFGRLASSVGQIGSRFSFSFPRFEKSCLEELARRGFKECEIVSRYFVTSLFEIPVEALEWHESCLKNISPNTLACLIRGQNERYHLAEAARAHGYECELFRPTLNGRILTEVLNRRYAEKYVDTALAVRITMHSNDKSLLQVIVTGDGDVEPALVTLPETYLLATGKPGRGSPAKWVDRKPFILEDHAREIIGDSILLNCFKCQRPMQHMEAITKHSANSCRYCDFILQTQNSLQSGYQKHPKEHWFPSSRASGRLTHRRFSSLPGKPWLPMRQAVILT